MFTYFGNHGLGDNAQIPIGHFKIVKQINGSDTYLQNSSGEQLGIIHFTFDNNKLYAEIQENFYKQHKNYVIWDLKTDNWSYYDTNDYLNIAKLNSYPTPDKFEDFSQFYHRHWSGWRFWLLP